MRKNAEKMDLSSRNRLLRVPAGSHGFWAHDPLPDPSHDPDVDPRRVTIPLAFTTHNRPAGHQNINLFNGVTCPAPYKSFCATSMYPHLHNPSVLFIVNTLLLLHACSDGQ